MLAPGAEQVLSVVLVEVTAVSYESGRQEHVSDYGRHLRPERLARGLPALPLDHQRLQQRDGAVHLGLNILQVGLDRLSLSDQLRVLLFVRGDALLQLADQILHFVASFLVGLGLFLQRVEFLTQRFHLFQHVGVEDLSHGPLDQRTARVTGVVDLFEIVIGIVEVTSLHFFADVVTKTHSMRVWKSAKWLGWVDMLAFTSRDGGARPLQRTLKTVRTNRRSDSVVRWLSEMASVSYQAHAYLMSSVLKLLTTVLMKLSRMMTARIDFQSLAFSPSNKQMDSRANFTTAGGFAMVRISTNCCFLIDFTAVQNRK
jgi:hypothetical protein